MRDKEKADCLMIALPQRYKDLLYDYTTIHFGTDLTYTFIKKKVIERWERYKTVEEREKKEKKKKEKSILNNLALYGKPFKPHQSKKKPSPKPEKKVERSEKKGGGSVKG
jgi:hypothetical protein